MDIGGREHGAYMQHMTSALFNRSQGNIWLAIADLRSAARMVGIKLPFLDLVDSNPLNPSVSDNLAMHQFFNENMEMVAEKSYLLFQDIRKKYANSGMRLVGPKPKKPEAPKAPQAPGVAGND